jgi:hypothetical protein
MDAWENRRTQQRGPSVDRILEKGLPVFPKLDCLDMSATVMFYDKLQKTSALFLLPLTLFDAVNLNMGFEGLCPPGFGLVHYADIAGVLMEVLPRLLPELDSQVTLLVTVVRAESNNGYDLLWRVLELAIPGFDPSLQLNAPIWMGDDIFDFCLVYVLYFRLQAKKGLVHDERTKSITFLQAVREPAYVDVITTLHAHIDTYLSKHDFGYLPPNLCMMGLATQMNKNARARIRDVLPHVARRLAWPRDDGYRLPLSSRAILRLKCIGVTSLASEIITGHVPLTAEVLAGTTALGFRTLVTIVTPGGTIPAVRTDPALTGTPTGTPGVVTLVRIIIVVHGIRKSFVRHANAEDTQRQIVICWPWHFFLTGM